MEIVVMLTIRCAICDSEESPCVLMRALVPVGGIHRWDMEKGKPASAHDWALCDKCMDHPDAMAIVMMLDGSYGDPGPPPFGIE